MQACTSRQTGLKTNTYTNIAGESKKQSESKGKRPCLLAEGDTLLEAGGKGGTLQEAGALQEAGGEGGALLEADSATGQENWRSATGGLSRRSVEPGKQEAAEAQSEAAAEQEQ